MSKKDQLDINAVYLRMDELVLDEALATLKTSTLKITPGRDEQYVLALCDRFLQLVGLRQHRFEFLRGDSHEDRPGVRLPVDAFYPDLRLVIEYRERQHIMPVPHFDARKTVSGMPRGEQRARYDRRRRDVLPRHGIQVVELTCNEFQQKASGRLVRDLVSDASIVGERLARFTPTGQRCPICRSSVTLNERYPNHVCGWCETRAVDDRGRTLQFANIDFSGGFAAFIESTGKPYDSHVCFIDGVACWADEARFGGIVTTPLKHSDVRNAFATE